MEPLVAIVGDMDQDPVASEEVLTRPTMYYPITLLVRVQHSKEYLYKLVGWLSKDLLSSG